MPDDAGWEAKDARRLELVDKLYSDGGLNDDEAAELHALELEAGRRHQGLVADRTLQATEDGHLGPVEFGWTKSGCEARKALKEFQSETTGDY